MVPEVSGIAGIVRCYHPEADLCGAIKGKTPANKRLCHQLAIFAATQIQSVLFLLAAAQLPQRAACVAISIPAWTRIEFVCFPTRNRQPKEQRQITVTASSNRQRSMVKFVRSR